MTLPVETITVERTDGTREYLLTILPATASLPASFKVASLLAGPLGSLLGGIMGLNESAGEASIEGKDVRGTLEAIGKALQEPSVMEVIELCMTTVSRIDIEPKTSTKSHRPIAWGTEFQGELGALLEVVKRFLVFNFTCFFVTGPAKGLRLAGLKLGASIRQAVSTGE